MLQIRVEATSANLSVGFDVLGLSLGLYNHFTFEKSDKLGFKGFLPEHSSENNLCYTSYVYTFNKCKKKPEPVIIGFNGDVPVSRGLGSSSTLIVAGVFAANYFMGGILSKDELFNFCVELEGHPDNVAPAVYGGLIASFKDRDEYYHLEYPVSKKLKFITAIPNYMLSTHEARGVLPKVYSIEDVVNNISRIVNIPYAFQTGNVELIKKLFNDRIHEPYRGKLIKEYELVKKIYANDLAAVAISGSGSTILIVCEDSSLADKLCGLDLNVKVLEVGSGVEIKEV